MLEKAITHDGVEVNLQITRDGEEVISYLLGERDFANRQAHPLPDVIVLDLKMPRMGGLDILNWLRNRPQCRDIPTIILSGSSVEKDVQEAYRLGANTFFTKPGGFLELSDLMHDVIHYWSRSQRPVLHHSC